MKNLKYLFLALVLSAGVVACSDDDNNDPKPTVPGTPVETPEQTPDTIPTEPTVPTVPTAPVASNVSSIKLYDAENEGFYELVTLVRNDEGKVTEITEANYTPEGTVQGESMVSTVTYAEGEVVVSNDYGKAVYAFDAAGKVASSEYIVVEDGEEYLYWTTTYNYTEAGLLSSIIVDMDGETMPLCEIAYGADNNMSSITVEEEEIDVTVSEILNEGSLDVNLLLLGSGYLEDVTYAIWSGLLSGTGAVVNSMYEGYITYEVTLDEAANISAVVVAEEGETVMNVELAY